MPSDPVRALTVRSIAHNIERRYPRPARALTPEGVEAAFDYGLRLAEAFVVPDPEAMAREAFNLWRDGIPETPIHATAMSGLQNQEAPDDQF